jgi:ariadne-1
MKCSNKGCRFEFCWTCLGPWTEHGQSTGGYYKCNKFKSVSNEEMAGMGESAKAKAELDKYIFYYQRYMNHEAAGRFAAKHRETTQKRMEELQAAAATSWADVAFLEQATEALLECRRVLKYTYVMGFYMKEGAEKRLFEHLQVRGRWGEGEREGEGGRCWFRWWPRVSHPLSFSLIPISPSLLVSQEHLEKNTEHLAELTEAPLEKMDRSEVVNFTRVTMQFLRNLLQGVEDGLTSPGGVGGGGGGGSGAGAAASAGGGKGR